MKRLNLFLMAAMAMAAVCLTACSDDEGDWDPFKWSGLSDSKANTVRVPAVGGTVSIECTNYSDFWVVEATSNVLGVSTHYNPKDEDTSQRRWVIENTTVTWQGRTLTVEFPRNDTGGVRTLEVMTECGDAFSHVTFVQPDISHL